MRSPVQLSSPALCTWFSRSPPWLSPYMSLKWLYSCQFPGQWSHYLLFSLSVLAVLTSLSSTPALKLLLTLESPCLFWFLLSASLPLSSHCPHLLVKRGGKASRWRAGRKTMSSKGKGYILPLRCFPLSLLKISHSLSPRLRPKKKACKNTFCSFI